jgi:hypothetical protein
VSCHQEEIKEVTESIAEEMETSELRKRLKAQIAAARLAPSAPGIGPVSGSTIVEELGKKNLKLTGIAAKMVDHMANYDSPDSTVMEYLSVNDKDAHDAWTRVATLRDHKAQLWIRLREEERAHLLRLTPHLQCVAEVDGDDSNNYNFDITIEVSDVCGSKGRPPTKQHGYLRLAWSFNMHQCVCVCASGVGQAR